MAHIFVIAGHGAGDSGAVGNGYQEAERVRALASRIAAYGGDNVTVGDTNRNWYADNGISSLSIPKDWQIIELHMDSASASARGGHVIIKSGLTADAYDNALANFIGGILPGRSNLIVGRSDLANPKRAAAKGYGYRLVEVGFISNADDVNIFNTRMDEIAKGILNAFSVNPSQTPSSSTNVQQSNTSSKITLAVDGSFGNNTVKRTQQYFGTTMDGIISNQPSSNKKYLYSAYSGAWEFKNSGYDAGSNVARAMQKLFGCTQDGWFGQDSVKHMQKFLGVTQDGSMGQATTKAWQTWLNNH